VKDVTIKGWPEGTIDPDLAALVFFSGDEAIASITSYATHPMSYYRTGVPGPDFPGIARFLRSQDVPTAVHLHFTGAGGNIAAGKYNDASPSNRVVLATRLAAAMRGAFAAATQNKKPITPASIGWGSVPVVLAARDGLELEKLAEEVRGKPDRGTFAPIDALAFATRAREAHAIDVTCLTVGGTRMLHLPGELFVEYQLAARQMRPDLDVFMAAYGKGATRCCRRVRLSARRRKGRFSTPSARCSRCRNDRSGATSPRGRGSRARSGDAGGRCRSDSGRRRLRRRAPPHSAGLPG
jgi:hypothetical protein